MVRSDAHLLIPESFIALKPKEMISRERRIRLFRFCIIQLNSANIFPPSRPLAVFILISNCSGFCNRDYWKSFQFIKSHWLIVKASTVCDRFIILQSWDNKTVIKWKKFQLHSIDGSWARRSGWWQGLVKNAIIHSLNKESVWLMKEERKLWGKNHVRNFQLRNQKISRENKLKRREKSYLASRATVRAVDEDKEGIFHFQALSEVLNFHEIRENYSTDIALLLINCVEIIFWQFLSMQACSGCTEITFCGLTRHCVRDSLPRRSPLWLSMKNSRAQCDEHCNGL